MYATSIMNLTDATWLATWESGCALSPRAFAIIRQKYFSMLSIILCLISLHLQSQFTNTGNEVSVISSFCYYVNLAANVTLAFPVGGIPNTVNSMEVSTFATASISLLKLFD